MFPLFRSQLYFFSAVGFFFDWVDSVQFVRTNSLNLEPSEEFQLETNSKADLNFFAKLRRSKNNYNWVLNIVDFYKSGIQNIRYAE